MNQLGRYMEEKGRTADEVAVDLSALLGKTISPNGVRLWSRRAKAPQAWADALNLAVEAEDSADFLADDPQSGDSTDRPLWREDDAPPTAPSSDKIIRPVGKVPNLSAKKRIEMAYGAIGSGASLITHNPGYEKVAESHAPAIADAWITAAEQNARVAKIVAFMESGGAVGELVVCHILLVLGLVYVSGRGPQLDFIYGSKFGGYRAAAAAERTVAETEAHLNGSGATAPEGAVVVPPV